MLTLDEARNSYSEEEIAKQVRLAYAMFLRPMIEEMIEKGDIDE